MHPYEGDSNPSPMLGQLRRFGAQSRRGSPARRCAAGGSRTVRVPATDGDPTSSSRSTWEELTELLSRELRRVVDTHGNNAIFGGSYGWASAGRFHHAQSQVHRFLNQLGGYTKSVHSYSLGATGVIMPRVVGTHWKLFARSTSWDVIAEHSDLLVCFGGVPIKNTGVNAGGTSDHPTRGALDAFRAPRRKDRLVQSVARRRRRRLPNGIAPVPGTDVAIMLALAYVLASEDLHDTAFLDRYCVGYDRFEDYLLGRSDGVPKIARVGQQISGIAARTSSPWPGGWRPAGRW